MKKNDSVFIPCTCGAAHHVVFTTPEEIYGLEKSDTDFLIIQVAVFGEKETASFWKRLKNAFCYIAKGKTTVVDEVVVSKAKASEIKDFIEEQLKAR